MGRLDFILSRMRRTPQKQKLAVFFDGKGCFSKVGKQMGLETKATDILPDEHIDLPIDIMKFKPEMFGNWIPDIIEFSPPCETFSGITHMKGGGNIYYQSTYNKNHVVSGIVPRTDFTIDKRLVNRNQVKLNQKRISHEQFVIKSIEIITYYSEKNPNLVWVIENPATGYMRYFLNGKIEYIENRATYCMYGASYRKETSFFSNIPLTLGFCPKHIDGVVDLCGGHSDSLVQRYDNKAQAKGVVTKSTYLERSSIPSKLCLDILSQAKKHIEKTISA